MTGIFVGVGLVVACGHSGANGGPDAGIPDASADASVAPADCTQWQVSIVYPDAALSSSGDLFPNSPTWDLPSGWEPVGLAYPGNGGARGILVRHCKQ